jgi:hypothetical protein
MRLALLRDSKQDVRGKLILIKHHGDYGKKVSLSSVVERYTSIPYWYVAVARSIRVARIFLPSFMNT